MPARVIKFSTTVDKAELEVFFRRSEKLKYQDRPAKKYIAYLLEQTQQQFEDEVDPTGKPWKKLKPSTLANKRTDKIGTETRAMRRSVYGRLTKAGRGEIAFKVPYAPFFDKERRLLGTTPEREREGQRIFEEHYQKYLGGV